MKNLSPSEVLDERISDTAILRAQRADNTRRQCEARDAILRLLYSAVLQSANAGNVRCIETVKEIQPHLDILLK